MSAGGILLQDWCRVQRVDSEKQRGKDSEGYSFAAGQ